MLSTTPSRYGVSSAFSRAIWEGDELRYGVRLANLDVNPLSEALLL